MTPKRLPKPKPPEKDEAKEALKRENEKWLDPLYPARERMKDLRGSIQKLEKKSDRKFGRVASVSPWESHNTGWTCPVCGESWVRMVARKGRVTYLCKRRCGE